MSSGSETAEVLVLGVLQGVTEFIPISSDGHLAIARFLLGVHDSGLAGTVLLHLGTLIATFLVLRADIRSALAATLASIRTRTLADDASREVVAVIVASIPTAIVGLALEPHVQRWSEDMTIVGVCLLISAAFVGASHWCRGGKLAALPVQSALLLGVVQGLAVLPGWSRSGSTIALGMMLGLTPIAAFRYSFLLSLPAVAGACLLELRAPETWAAFSSTDYVAAAVAFVTGVIALRTLRRVVAGGAFALFAPYLVMLGTFVLTVLTGE